MPIKHTVNQKVYVVSEYLLSTVSLYVSFYVER